MGGKKLLLFFIFQVVIGYSQTTAKDSIKLEEVIVSITKIRDSIKNTPYSISANDYSNFQNNAQQFYLSEYIERIPGVFISNDNNFAQDSRISIRGFGSRANFGIRGIKLIVDGVPETTPDGQSQIDNLNLELIKNIEVIRGTSSSLYGNSSAGVIKIKSITDFDKNFSKISYSTGSHSQVKKQAFFGIKNKNSYYTVLLGETKAKGYRSYSDFKNSNFNLNFKKNFSKNSWLNVNFNIVSSPYAKDAGGLTLNEVTDNRTQARKRNSQYKTEEDINHYKFSSSFNNEISKSVLFSTYTFFSKRYYNGKIPVENGGAIKLNRDYWGIGLNFQINSRAETHIGIDFGNQNDLRKRFNNIKGEIGDLVLNQYEKFKNLGIYLVNNFQIKNFTINSGFRYDLNRIEMEDLISENINLHDQITLKSFNPSLGINFKINKNSRVFINTSSGFETPTLNEYSATPIGTGFNKDLKSQKNMGYELGASLFNLSKKFSLDIVFFESVTNDEVLSYEDENFPDQKFYNNAGKSKRKGIEIAGLLKLNNTILSSSYSSGDYYFKDFSENSNDYSGNKIPGIPKNIFTLSLEHRTKNNVFLNFNFKNIGEIYADNSNVTKIDKFNTLNFKMGKEFEVSKSVIYPYLIINNIFQSEYFDNIRINAFGGRYYEPAPKRTIFGGIRVTF
jgi:iron complex outermembrane receptor protein